MHEVLLTRGDFPKDMQHLIWHRCNCQLVHPNCHPVAGTRENQIKLIYSLFWFEGASNIMNWLANVEQYTKGMQIQNAIRLVKECINGSN